MSPEKDQNPKYGNCRFFAMKVINKSALLKKSSFEQKQMIREIQMQRRLRHCGNTIKLHKIYESDSFINMLMEF
jgi:serine/threonine protein kinase